MNQKRLSERKVLITAASSGIGFAIASVLAEKGVTIFMTSGSSRIEASADSLRKRGLRVESSVFNMVTEDPADIVEKASKSMGGIDTLVVNYGDPTLAPFMDIGDEDWDRYISMFIRATVGLVRETIKIIGSEGRIIFITSMPTIYWDICSVYVRRLRAAEEAHQVANFIRFPNPPNRYA